jgi:hypothetical protein
VGVSGIQCMFTTFPPQNVDVSKSVNRRFVVCKSDTVAGTMAVVIVAKEHYSTDESFCQRWFSAFDYHRTIVICASGILGTPTLTSFWRQLVSSLAMTSAHVLDARLLPRCNALNGQTC